MTERKKQKLIAKWKKKGFSDEEIQKLLKTAQKKTIAKVVVGSLATVVFVAGLVITVGKVLNSNSNEPTKEDKHLKKEDEELRKDLENDVPDKNPDDIEIPKIPTKEEGATDEEIAEAEEKAKAAEEEKSYWSVVKDSKDQIKQEIKNMASNPPDGMKYGDAIKNFDSVRRINNILVDKNNNLIIDCDIIYTTAITSEDTVLRQANALIEFSNSNTDVSFNNANDVLKFINDKDTKINYKTMNKTSVLNEEMKSCVDSFYNNYLAKHLSFKNDGEIELQNISCTINEGEEIPTNYHCLVKITNEDVVTYQFVTYWTGSLTSDMTLDEWKTFVNQPASTMKGLTKQYNYKLYDLGFDWSELAEKFAGETTKSPEAQAEEEIDSQSIKDEQGRVVGLKWNSTKKSAENKIEPEMTDTSSNLKVLYSDQGLSL